MPILIYELFDVRMCRCCFYWCLCIWLFCFPSF